MVIIKINEVPNTKSALKDRAERAWRINSGRLYNESDLIVVYRGEILEQYKIRGYQQDTLQPERVVFDLEDVDSSLKGKKIVYRTANPCTIVDESELVFK